MNDNTQTSISEPQHRSIRNPYRNILFCSECGAAMRYQQNKKAKTGPLASYVCVTGLKTDQCSRKETRFDYVDHHIRQALQSEIQLADSVYQKISSEGIPSAYRNTDEHSQSEISALLADIQKDQVAFQNLRTEYLNGDIDSDQYRLRKQDLDHQTEITSSRLLAAMTHKDSAQTLFSEANPWLNLYHGKALPDVLPQKLAKSYIEKAFLSPEGNITITLKHQDWKQQLLEALEEM